MTTNAIERCRKALESDDMLAWATRDDFSELLSERDALRARLDRLAAAAESPQPDPDAKLRELREWVRERGAPKDGPGRSVLSYDLLAEINLLLAEPASEPQHPFTATQYFMLLDEDKRCGTTLAKDYLAKHPVSAIMLTEIDRLFVWPSPEPPKDPDRTPRCYVPTKPEPSADAREATTNINDWITRMEALAKAATPGPWIVCHSEHPRKDENIAHIAAWNPDVVQRVLAVVQAAKDLLAHNPESYSRNAPGHSHQRPGIWDDDNLPNKAGKPCSYCLAWSNMRASIDALAGGKP